MAEPLAVEFIALQRALAGRYSLERELGRGGMGIVFLARDVALDRPVAIKLLPPAMAAQPTLRERFLREAQTAAKLSHPNIIPIFAVDQVDGFVFFVMAYVEGETLGRRLQTRGPLNPSDGTRLIQEVAWALAYAHLRGIVHRDIKPDNILLEQGTGRALVSDFGIARLTDTSGGTAVGEVLGTAQFMSPEQATGEAVDGRSDLYSLGVVAFYALSGRLPFDAAQVPALLAMHITKPAPLLASVAAGVPGKLAQAVDRCLAKDPAERFQTGEALAEAVAASTGVSRDIPAPIRVWLTRGETAKLPLRIITVLAGLGFTIPLVFRGTLAWGELGWIAVPWSLFALFRLYYTQRVLSAGYSVEDIRLALRDRAQQLREELVFESSSEPPVVARAIRKVTWVSFGAAIGAGLLLAVLPWDAGVLGGFTLSGGLANWLGGIFGVGSFVSLAGGLVGRVMPGKRLPLADPARRFQSRIWNGRLGEWFARIARIGMGRPSLSASSAHRPTEIAIAMAADALFNALPREARKALKDLPAAIQRLEADAQGLRARVDELNALMAGAGDESVAAQSDSLRRGADAVAEARQKLHEDLAAERDGAARRLATAVAALENIRLDLLRLAAGVGTVDQISADLTAARRIGADVDAVLAGRREVEALLAPPSRNRAAPSPP